MLSIGHSVINALKNFLTVADKTPLTSEDLPEKQLLLNLNFYFDKLVNDEQRKGMPVCRTKYYERGKKEDKFTSLVKIKKNQ